MDFDPDQYLQQSQIQKPAPADPSGFDPDAYLADSASSPQSGGVAQKALDLFTTYTPTGRIAKAIYEDPQRALTFAEQAGDVASFGHLPQIAAMETQGALKARDWLRGTHDADQVSYTDARDQIRKDMDQHMADHPWFGWPGRVAGIAGGAGTLMKGAAAAGGKALAASGIADTGLAQSLGGSFNALSPATQQTIEGGITGGAWGALNNPGDHPGEIDPLQVGERSKGAAQNAAIGVALSGLFGVGKDILGTRGGPGPGTSGSGAAGIAEDASKRSGFRALGPFKRDAKQALARDNVEGIGGTALEKGVIGWIPRSAETLADRAEALKEPVGKQIGQTVDELSQHDMVPQYAPVETRTPASRMEIQQGLPLEGREGTTSRTPMDFTKTPAGTHVQDPLGSSSFEDRESYLPGFPEFKTVTKERTPPVSLGSRVETELGSQPGLPLEQTKTPLGVPINSTQATEIEGEQMGLPLRTKTGEAPPPGLGMSRGEIAERMRSRLLAPSSVPGVQGQNQQLSQLVDEFEGGGSPELSLREGHQLKRDVNGQIQWDRLPGADIPLKEQFHRALYHELKDGENAIAEKLAQDGRPDLRDLKSTYGNLETAQKIATNRAASQNANQVLGLRDAITGGAGATIGAGIGYKLDGPEGAKHGAMIGGALGGFGSKFARDYGAQVSAKSLDALSRVLQGGGALSDAVAKNPQAAPALLQMLQGPRQPQTAPATPAIQPEILSLLKRNPALIETIQDQGLREQLKKYINGGNGGEK